MEVALSHNLHCHFDTPTLFLLENIQYFTLAIEMVSVTKLKGDGGGGGAQHLLTLNYSLH